MTKIYHNNLFLQPRFELAAPLPQIGKEYWYLNTLGRQMPVTLLCHIMRDSVYTALLHGCVQMCTAQKHIPTRFTEM
jgi:hypothetical protein